MTDEIRRPYTRPLITKFFVPANKIETYQAASGTVNVVGCQTGDCTGEGASAEEMPPWLLP